MTNKEKFYFLEKCNFVFNTKRMGHVGGPIEPQNSVQGLYKLIKNYFKEDFIMAEIGSFHGTSTILFSLFVKKLYSIDPYEYHIPPEGPVKEMDDLMVEAEKIFIERTKDIENIIKVRKKSVEASKDFEDRSLDCVYVDGEHTYKHINEDIGAWKDKIKKGGILCGHDYDFHHSAKIKEILTNYNLLDNTFQVYPDTSWSVII